jgi:hypothetical protein
MSVITWRPGGLKRSAEFMTWNAALGRTGFVNGRRVIEEPNHFSTIAREMFEKGFFSLFHGSSYANDLDTLMEQVWVTPDETFRVFWGYERGGAFIIVRTVGLRRQSRMTWHESWIESDSKESEYTYR